MCPQNDSEDPPQNFICPLTLEVMKNPLKDPVTKRSFEKKAILTWLDTSNGICPITRRPLEPEELVADKALSKKIKKWKKERRFSLHSDDFDDGTQQQSNNREQKHQPESKLDNRLLDIRSRVLAKRSKRFDRSFSTGDIENDVPQDTIENERKTQSFCSFSSGTRNRILSGINCDEGAKSTKLSGIVSSAINDIWTSDNLVDDDDTTVNEMISVFENRYEI